jgi:hypothetical protein
MNTYRFNVSFDAAADPSKAVTITPRKVQVAPEEVSLITFTLDCSGAKFPSTPIQWLHDQEPVDLPAWFVMHRHSPRYFALWDFNSTPESIDHNFQVSVFYNGQIYSSHDPVIVNEPPIG